INTVADSLRAQWKKVRNIEGQAVDECRDTLMGIEGVSGRIYWDAVGEVIRGKTEFLGRAHRGAADAVNAMLNYGYGILYGNVWGAVLNAGLEPFAGFLHVDRPGKPSLVLDMIEEFRQPVVDRAIIAALGKGTTIETQGGLLTDSSRRTIARLVLERLESEVIFRGQRHQLLSRAHIQARILASPLRR